MKKLVAPVLVVAGLSASLLVGATSVSWAQDQPSCAQAISAFIDAKAAFEELPERVEGDVPNPALPGLRTAVGTAKGVLAEKVAAATAAGFPPADQTEGQLERLRKIAAPEDSDTTDTQDDAAENAEAAPKIAALEAVFTAQRQLFNAENALKSAPEKTKGRVPNPALKAGPELDALVKTQNDADRICEGQPNDPGPANPGNPSTTPSTPAPPANDSNDDNGAVNEDDGLNPGPIVASVVTPVGGVETGGGPE